WSLTPFLFFTATASSEIYTLSLHDALPICTLPTLTRVTSRLLLVSMMETSSVSELLTQTNFPSGVITIQFGPSPVATRPVIFLRSEEHTSELQSRGHLVCRLLLEKKKINSI